MSVRVDTASLIAGAVVVGHRGLGVLGSAIPSTGEHGPGYLYNDLTLPGDAGKEVRGLVVTPPAIGTFFAWEDSSFTFDAPDGIYTFVYRLFVDGVDMGTATATIQVGNVDVLTGLVLLADGKVVLKTGMVYDDLKIYLAPDGSLVARHAPELDEYLVNELTI